ncbi:MAG: C69 family dipeptidase [Bacteroidaceae bacterium]|nr:C69 family dipeptidase [Bacteroidaceae bacterium]
MKKLIVLLTLLTFNFQLSTFNSALACTNLIVGKKASADGSVIVTYSSDDYGAYGFLFYQKGGKHQPGEMRKLYHYESNNYLGEIPEADSTYAVIGLTNEHQVTIHETTWGGREELADSTGLFDYGSLMQVTLQRARTAREALKIMTDLVAQYGYQSEGESFTIADPNEVWVMDMIGKGPGGGAPVWVAVRIPDDCISGHANQSRIHQFPLKDKENCIYSKDVITFAKKKGYFTGKDKDFSFADAYNPLDFGGARYCEARVWSFFNKWGSEDMSKYLKYAMGEDLKAEPFPLYMKPKKLLTVQDVKDMMRDHYEGTPMDISTGLGAGPWEMPYRPTPLSYEVDGKKYFNERPISTQQASCIYVAQMRSWLPDYVGGVLWFGNDDANMVAMVPIYCCTVDAPECFNEQTGDTFTFSFKSAYWMQNWVANMVYLRYSLLFPELAKVRNGLEAEFNANQPEVEKEALAMTEAEARKYLSNYSHAQSQVMMDHWMWLAQHIIVRYNDMAQKKMDADEADYLKTPGGNQVPVNRPGYPERYRRSIVKETGDKYLIK